LEVRTKIGGADKSPHGSAIPLQCPKAGGQQDGEFSIVVDVGRRADKTVADRHDRGFQPRYDRGSEFQMADT
jgi:hypothetical protein